MLDVRVDVDSKPLKNLAREYPALFKAVGAAKMDEALLLIERLVKQKAPYGAGPIHLRDTIHGTSRVYASKVVGTIGTPLAYGDPVELGTKPHFPPLAPIQHWVERKLRIEAPESKSVAFAVARKIAIEGTEGAKMFAESMEEGEIRIMAILDGIVAEIVRRAG